MARRKGAKPIRVADSGPAPQQVAIPATERMVNTEDVVDIHPIHDVTTDLCRRLGIREGTPLRIVEYEGRFEVTPMRLVPAIDNPAEGLEVLVAGITPENIHGEFDTGPAVGQESW
jgi:hypothetical protein